MQPEKMVLSATSCPALILRDARSIPSSSHLRKSWTTTSSGVLRRSISGESASGNFGKRANAGAVSHERYLETALSGYPRLRALSLTEWGSRSQILSERLQESAKGTFPGSLRTAG